MSRYTVIEDTRMRSATSCTVRKRALLSPWANAVSPYSERWRSPYAIECPVVHRDDAMQVLMLHDADDFEAIARYAMHLADDCRRKLGLEPTDDLK